MKLNVFVIFVAVLALLIFGIAAERKDAIREQYEQRLEAETKRFRTAEQVATLQEQLRGPPYVQPLDQAWISSGVGYRLDPMGGGTEALHRGVDLVGPIGAPVKAIMDGVVVEHWPAPDGYWHGHPVFGGLVVIDHGGFFVMYGHLKSSTVHQDQRVVAGQIIGELGDTGICTGPHLHFEIVVDPFRYLEGR